MSVLSQAQTAAKMAKAMISMVIASVTKNPLRKKCQNPCTAQLPFSSLSDLFRMLPCFGLCFAWFVGLLTDLFRLRVSSPLAISRLTANALLQPSLGAMTALPMTGFHRAQISLHGKQYFRNTATFGILPSPLHSMIHRLQTDRRDSFRVRDLHPIPLFSEQACVSDLPRGAGSKLSL